ncbi:U11/U12 small nuclear ribonucleoprotein [Armadillidium nasatum]|uniref:U11/U12 small nuclear ribonucleoprotein n=1 Tax=Armadillidium nasatum TaxID=96803 RepID=A0A5N5SUU0_9CRUS|nr:U11/U12 small nuclear ribonucleoprotein [Armadillidium nasatum]
MAEGEEYSDSKMNNSVSNKCSSSDSMSHPELIRLFQQTLKQMVINDPLLKGLHEQVTLEEVEAVLALERGQAITILVERNNGEPWRVVVSQNSTLYQFKLALKHHAALHLARQGHNKKLSWKHIWRIYDLSFNGTRITDDNRKLINPLLNGETV